MQKVKDVAAPKGSEAPVASKAEKPAAAGRDWSETLFLPKTDFPMKAGLPSLEPKLLERWQKTKLFKQLRKAAKGREKFTLHDGPPYANGNIHIGTALNKILKDMVVRSQTQLDKDSNYVPGWDCHGLPIEWKIEEQYRAKGKDKDAVPIIEFRRECREFAEKWIDIQREEFKRLGVEGDWENPYTTMTFDAEATIANELMKFAMNGALYEGSKPVMWSVVERTALAEAEVEYEEHVSPTIFVKFPVQPSPLAGEGGAKRRVRGEATSKSPLTQPPAAAALSHERRGQDLAGASVVIWTTTPWTIPGNRAIAYSPKISYGAYQVKAAPEDNWAKTGDKLVVADALAENLKNAARIESWERLGDVDPAQIKAVRHPFHGKGYDFQVRLYEGDFVTEDTGTGFVHIAPGHGADDYELFVKHKKSFEEAGIPEVPHTVGEDGFYFEHVPLFGGKEPKRVINDNGKFGDANDAVIQALIEANALVARGKLRHQYPHSWRSKAPVIFRNTPQWFIGIDKPTKVKGVKGKIKKGTIRELALKAIDDTRFVPATGQNRLRGMIEARPDWVISRQRAWGVPITVFVHEKTGEVIPNAEFNSSAELIDRIVKAFEKEGADAWFKTGAHERFLKGLVADPAEWKKVDDILDVWFESGSTHAFVLEKRKDLGWPAALYLEGSDQHRGWFHSSLLESCGTRGRAPFDAVLTHGFILDEKGEEKMSKSKGNTLSPQDVAKQNGAEILRLWVASSDYSGDIRFGPGIVQSSVESYRKLRNTLRFMLGNLDHYRARATRRLRRDAGAGAFPSAPALGA